MTRLQVAGLALFTAFGAMSVDPAPAQGNFRSVRALGGVSSDAGNAVAVWFEGEATSLYLMRLLKPMSIR